MHSALTLLKKKENWNILYIQIILLTRTRRPVKKKTFLWHVYTFYLDVKKQNKHGPKKFHGHILYHLST